MIDGTTPSRVTQLTGVGGAPGIRSSTIHDCRQSGYLNGRVLRLPLSPKLSSRSAADKEVMVYLVVLDELNKGSRVTPTCTPNMNRKAMYGLVPGYICTRTNAHTFARFGSEPKCHDFPGKLYGKRSPRVYNNNNQHGSDVVRKRRRHLRTVGVRRYIPLAPFLHRPPTLGVYFYMTTIYLFLCVSSISANNAVLCTIAPSPPKTTSQAA